jgi:DNA-binding response OmpR family regulator
MDATDVVRVPQHPGCIMGPVNATRVLVVDDEPMVREVLARYLAKEGYAVDVAEDGEQALAAYAQALPDLVLLDLMLPRIDGLEVFRRIREQAPRP